MPLLVLAGFVVSYFMVAFVAVFVSVWRYDRAEARARDMARHPAGRGRRQLDPNLLAPWDAL